MPSGRTLWPGGRSAGLYLGSRRRVDIHNGAEHPERVVPATLEGVAADHRPEPAPGLDGADFVEQLVIVGDNSAPEKMTMRRPAKAQSTT